MWLEDPEYEEYEEYVTRGEWKPSWGSIPVPPSWPDNVYFPRNGEWPEWPAEMPARRGQNNYTNRIIDPDIKCSNLSDREQCDHHFKCTWTKKKCRMKRAMTDRGILERMEEHRDYPRQKQ